MWAAMMEVLPVVVATQLRVDPLVAAMKASVVVPLVAVAVSPEAAAAAAPLGAVVVVLPVAVAVAVALLEVVAAAAPLPVGPLVESLGPSPTVLLAALPAASLATKSFL